MEMLETMQCWNYNNDENCDNAKYFGDVENCGNAENYGNA